jgi:hypothetical protein
LGFSQGAVTAHLLAITKQKYEHEKQAKKGENNLLEKRLGSFLGSLTFFICSNGFPARCVQPSSSGDSFAINNSIGGAASGSGSCGSSDGHGNSAATTATGETYCDGDRGSDGNGSFDFPLLCYPSLHIIGAKDQVVDPELQRELAARFESNTDMSQPNTQVLYEHDDEKRLGHFMPQTAPLIQGTLRPFLCDQLHLIQKGC